MSRRQLAISNILIVLSRDDVPQLDMVVLAAVNARMGSQELTIGEFDGIIKALQDEGLVVGRVKAVGTKWALTDKGFAEVHS